MLQNILNLEGVTVLGKKQLLGVNGGGKCKLNLIDADGDAAFTWINATFTVASDASSAANNRCVDLIINHGAQSCRYDCDHDGWGQ